MVKVPLPLNANTKRKHKTQAQNTTTKRKHKTLPLMVATRPASGIKEKAYTLNKGSALITRQSVNLYLDARRGTRRPH